MKPKYLFPILTALAAIGCYKEAAVEPVGKSPKLKGGGPQAVASCNDTSAFKNEIDLLPLTHIGDCYIAHATKEVPGLGQVAWTANTRALTGSGKLSIVFETYSYWDDVMYLRETISMSMVDLAIGTYDLENGFYLRTTSDGDVFDGTWVLDTNCVNTVHVQQLDMECKEVRGTFDAHYIVDDPSPNVQRSERINLLNGRFEARIVKY